jgi:hypothetical protein
MRRNPGVNFRKPFETFSRHPRHPLESKRRLSLGQPVRKKRDAKRSFVARRTTNPGRAVPDLPAERSRDHSSGRSRFLARRLSPATRREGCSLLHGARRLRQGHGPSTSRHLQLKRLCDARLNILCLIRNRPYKKDVQGREIQGQESK